jgi:hypothetical protein
MVVGLAQVIDYSFTYICRYALKDDFESTVVVLSTYITVMNRS